VSDLRHRKTWQKVFYVLLLKYRTRHLENFNMDDEEPIQRKAPKRPPPPTAAVISTAAKRQCVWLLGSAGLGLSDS
jgi:hypothetical protein